MEQTLYSLLSEASAFPEWLLCIILLALAILQYVFPPVPSDTLLVALGILVSQHVFHDFLGFTAYSIGAVIGALGLFTLTYMLGDRVRKIKFVNNLIDENTHAKAHAVIEKYGCGSYFLLRFVPSMQCITIIVMGLAKVKKSKAHFYISCVTVFACAVYYLLGLLLGSNISKLLSVLEAIGTAGKVILAIIIAAAVIAVIVVKLKNKRNKD